MMYDPNGDNMVHLAVGMVICALVFALVLM